jgi:hypothetical protein
LPLPAWHTDPIASSFTWLPSLFINCCGTAITKKLRGKSPSALGPTTAGK